MRLLPSLEGMARCQGCWHCPPTTGRAMSEPQYSAIHMTRIDAEIFATRVGRVAGAMYLQEDAKASDLMAGAIAWDERMRKLMR